MTWNSEVPSPHFYPCFDLVDGRLARYVPSIKSLSEMEGASRDPARCDALIAELAARDEFYDPWVFRDGSADASVIARLARRSWGQRSFVRDGHFIAEKDEQHVRKLAELTKHRLNRHWRAGNSPRRPTQRRGDARLDSGA